MQLRSLLRILSLIVASVAIDAAASSSGLTLPHLFSFEFQAAPGLNAITYPYGGGQRLNIALAGGVMTMPTNGTVATLVPSPGGDQGVFREDGVFLVDGRHVLQVEESLDPDRKFAFLQFRGKSRVLEDGTGKGLIYIEFETDSPALAYLNAYFLAGNLTRSGSTLNVDVYGADPSTI